MRHAAAAALVICLLGAPAARAGDGPVAAAAQAVITSQLEAFEREDGAAAFNLAAPEVRALFSDPGTFMAMVQHGYLPVYRHRSYEFGTGREADGKFAQTARVIDAQGVPWNALYTLERQPDDSWKITGCVLRRAVDEPA